MFGQKFKKEHLMNAFNKAKNFVGDAYLKSKNILNNIDNGVKIGKQIYSQVSPYINKYLGNHSKSIHDNLIKGISKYDDIKNKVLENHDDIINDYNNVKHKLFKNV
jgi:uncharacterized coiled-coil DUF342 family protein